jgi:hypothetical protein
VIIALSEDKQMSGCKRMPFGVAGVSGLLTRIASLNQPIWTCSQQLSDMPIYAVRSYSSGIV